MSRIKKYILEQVASRQLSQTEAKDLLLELVDPQTGRDEIAIIGMACKFPGAENIDALWSNLKNGVCAIGDFPTHRLNDLPNSMLAPVAGQEASKMKGAFLGEIDKFDPAFFRISPKEALYMEPAQRIFLETAYEVIEDAGYGGDTIRGTRTGVFVGHDHTNTSPYQKLMPADELSATGSWAGILATRISYILNLNGPGMVVDTACSSGAAAVHLACQSLKMKECDLAIAAGICIIFQPGGHEQYSALKLVESADGTVRAFDKDANGTVWGEGVGAVLLKPLSQAIRDGDNIHAVIKGSLLNNDGASNGITAPNAEAQEKLLVEAWKAAQVNPETISYIEAHGTGTILGDPVEIKGLTNAFRRFTPKKQFCRIGSVKTNIGHTVAASGLASLLKVVLALKHREIPASLNYQTSNPYIQFGESPVVVNDKLSPWLSEGHPLRAGVNAFGFSGTNCHIVLEEAPPLPVVETPRENGGHILALSAKSKGALEMLVARYRRFLNEKNDWQLADICYTANTGRGHYQYRLAFIFNSKDELNGQMEGMAGLIGIDATEYSQKGVYYGEYKAASNHGVNPGEAEQRMYLEVAVSKLNADPETVPETEVLHELAQLYIQGVEIPWRELYRFQKRRRVSLPAYPFERIRLWPEIIHELRPFDPEQNQMAGLEANHFYETETESIVLNGKTEYSVLERQLAQIWGQQLGIKEVNVYADFYELGGDSIIAIKMTNSINQRLATHLEMGDLLQYSTIAGLAEYLEQKCFVEPGVIAEESQRSAPENGYDLTHAQKQMWLMQTMNPQMFAYNVTGVLPINHELDLNLFTKAVNAMISRHESLRTIFPAEDGIPRQIILPQSDFPAPEVVELTGREDRETALRELIWSENRQPFNLASGPLLRIKLFRLETNAYQLYLNVHHIITDGWSMGLLADELMNNYQQYLEGKDVALIPVRPGYIDWMQQQAEWEKSVEFQKVEQYWLQELEKPLAALDLPADFPRPPVMTFNGGHFNFVISQSQTAQLKRIAKSRSTTLHMLLLAEYFLLLHKITQDQDIVIGSPITGRDSREVERIIGLFVNTVCIRVKFEELITFRDLLDCVKCKCLKAYQNGKYPFELIVAKVNPERDPGRNPIYSTLFQFYDQIGPGNEGICLIDLGFLCREAGETIEVRIEYNTDLFSAETIQRLSGYYATITEAIIEDSNQSLAAIEILTAMEKRRVLFEFNNTYAAYPQDKTLFQLFEEQAAKTPENVAVVYQSHQLTYRELNNKANHIAGLLRKKHIKPDTIVGIMVERSLEMIIGILGILKAGGAFLPIGPDYPEERIRYMLEDSRATVLLTQHPFKAKYSDWDIIELDEPANYRGTAHNPEPIHQPHNLAYVIYTSGSTGKPKGVLIEHQNIADRIQWRKAEYQLNGGDRVLLIVAYTFDAFVTTLFTPLVSGAGVYLINENDAKNIIVMKERIIADRITHFSCVPTLYAALLETLEGNEAQHLKIVTLGGEKVTADLVKKTREISRSVELINEYGPTECAVVSTFLRNLQPEVQITIGKPVANTQVYIVDQNCRILPIGVPGELCIGGAGVARGYLNLPELTAERFVQNPYEPGKRMYRTGDMARWQPDGNIEFLGRMDHQVKIRGYRIELGEIENQLLKHEGIQEAIVINSPDPKGAEQLGAYIVAGRELTISEVREYLSRKLPDYMLPNYLVHLEKLPLTPNGKIDRNSLPLPDGDFRSGVEFVAPRNEIEANLVRVWQSVLGIENIGIYDNFFTLGGDSIKVIQVVARLGKYGLKTAVDEFYRHPMIAELSQSITEVTLSAPQEAVEGEVKLTPVQKWFFAQPFIQPNHFNQSVMLYRKEGFNEATLREVLAALVVHHDALRMSFRLAVHGITQYNRGIQTGDSFGLERFDLSKETAWEAKLSRIAQEIQSSLNITKGPLVRIGLFHTENGDHLLLAVHHLVIDGVSWRILLEDLSNAYQQVRQGRPISLPSKSASFRDWAMRLAEYAQSKAVQREIAYWKRLEQIKIGKLPRDYEIHRDQVKDARTLNLVLTETETETLLKQVNRAYQTEANDLLLTALGMALKEWAGGNRFVINLEGHGRETLNEVLDISRTVGWFTSFYPVVLDMQYSDELGYQIKSLKEELRRIPKKGIGYGILRYLTPEERKDDLTFALEPEISFNYLGQFDQEVNTEVFGLSPLANENQVGGENERQFAIEINGAVTKRRLTLSFGYNQMEYRAETIQRLVDLYQQKLLQVLEHCLGRESEKTPADFGDTRLSLDELAVITERFGSNLQKIYPLSNMQAGMLFHALMEPHSQAYYEQAIIPIKGDLKIELVEQSFNRLIQRYDIMRTSFQHEGLKSPRQVVVKGNELTIDYHEAGLHQKTERQAWIENYLQKERERGFDLSKDQLMRVSIIKTGIEEYELIWSFHHILMDGWCIGIIIKEFLQIYQSLSQNQPLQLPNPKPYSDYIDWMGKQDLEDATAYWQKYFEGYDRQTGLPKTNSAKNTGYQQKNISFSLDEELTKGLETVASVQQVTLNTVFQSIWGLLLQKYNNVEDVVFGVVVSGRPAEIPGIEQMVGLFINTVPVRIQAADCEVFNDLVKRVQQAAVESVPYGYLSLAELQTKTELKQQLFDHIVVFENYPLDEAVAYINSGEHELRIADVKLFEQTSYDLNLIVKSGKELSIHLNYNGLVYEEALLERVEKHFKQIVKAVVANPNRAVGDIEIISDTEKQQILDEFNATGADYPHKTIHQLFEEQVLQHPHSIALDYEDRTTTYLELNEQANRLARVLQDKGVGPNRVVGIMMRRSPEFMVGVWAILKAGGAYLPIDPEYPENRILQILTNSRVNVLLSDSQSINGSVVSAIEKEQLLLLDELGEVLAQKSNRNLPCCSKPEDLLYVINTSGSTGEPKGVMIEHRNIVNLINFEYQKTGIDFTGKVLQFTTTCFDVCYQETFSTLLAGGRLYIIGDETKQEPRKLFQYIEERGIGVVFLPTAYLKYIINEKEVLQNFPTGVNHLITAGEQLIITEVFRDFLSSREVVLHNHYGPSETHVVTTFSICQGDAMPDLPPIGKPIDNIKAYIFNSHQQLCPVGIAGELWISGAGVGKGYLNRPELTNERFVPDVFNPRERMYRTGDLARWLPDGNIEFLGRIDHQVKIRGFRIELGEIESHLLKHEAIQEAIVIAREDKRGAKYLCAYCVGAQELNLGSLRQYLARELPEYMLPSYYVQLSKLPLTPNGKINRKALPEPDVNLQVGADYVPPTNVLETKLAALWQEVLGLERIGIHDNFFELGGHSLKATSVISRIAKEFEVEIPLREIFQKPTIRELAESICKAAGSYLYANIEPAPQKDYYPVSSAQKRLYILNQMEGVGIGYNMPGMLSIEGDLQRERLETAFQGLIRRHETLRTSFEMTAGEPVQRVHEHVDFAIEYHEVAESERELVIKDFIRPFDLSRAPLLRVGLLRHSPMKYTLLCDMHHIISDGESMGVLVREFIGLYRGVNLPELRLQYKDFSAWQNEFANTEAIAAQESYWCRIFEGEIPVLDFPTDYVRPTIQSFEGANFVFHLEADGAGRLNQLAQENGSTLYMVLLAAYNVLLAKYTGHDDLVVGSPIAGRPHSDLAAIIGVFINTLAMRNTPQGEQTFREFLAEVRDNAIAAYENQDYPFEKLVEKLNIPRDLSRNPLFDTMFDLQNFNAGQFAIPGLEITPCPLAGKIAKFDLSLQATENDAGIVFELEYSTALFKSATIERMATHYLQILRQIVANPELKLAEIEMISPAEKRMILERFNDTETDLPQNQVFHQLFETQVAKTPDNIAVVFGEQQLSYRELNQKANQLGRFLREKGVKPETLVGIMAERSVEMVVGILGILKSGGAYVPIDPTYPEERINAIIEDSNISIMLTNFQWPGQTRINGELIHIGEQTIYHKENTDLEAVSKPTDLAYVIYTSGSTGKPKGVMIENASLVNVSLAWKNAFQLDRFEIRLLQLASFSFDVFTGDLAKALLNGGQIIICPSEVRFDPIALYELMKKHRISIFESTPALMIPLMKYIYEKQLEVSFLKFLILGSDVCSVEDFGEIVSRFGSQMRIVNTYGTTETTIDSSYYEESLNKIPECGIAPVGKPLQNVRIYILSKELTPQPVGIFGELYIAGISLARGYINRPELTAEKFVANPFAPNERMYKTGDLARWLPDGNLEFLGRVDHQVKIRGFRIELGEIENQLLRHESIVETVVVAREDPNRTKYLCAYIVAEKQMTPKEIREFLDRELPHYMIPSYFVQLEKIPLTQNGKIDRKSLPEPACEVQSEVEYIGPATEVESQIQTIWESVLGIEKIGIRENFFVIGGNSLKAMQVAIKLSEDFEISVNDLFKYQTIESLAKQVVYSKGRLKARIESVKEMLSTSKVTENPGLECQTKLTEYSAKNEEYRDLNLDLRCNYRKVLLLGSTGFLGAHLLYQLFRQTEVEIYTIVRGRDQDEAQNRLWNRLNYYFQFSGVERERLNQRMHVLQGDLTCERLGLSEELYQGLADQMDTVINSAANVNHFGLYSDFHAINVGSNERLIEFLKTGRAKDFNLISTISIGGGNIENTAYTFFTEDDCDLGQEIDNDYVKTKFEAEKLILKIRSEGINANVFRVGNLVFDATTGVFQENIQNNAFYALIKALIGIGLFPDIEEPNIDFTFVDQAAGAVVKLFDRKNLLNGTYHIYNNHKISLGSFAESLKRIGLKAELIQLTEFLDLLYEKANDDQLREHIADIILHTHILEPGNKTEFEILSQKTEQLLLRLGFEWDRVDDQKIELMMQYCRQANFIK